MITQGWPSKMIRYNITWGDFRHNVYDKWMTLNNVMQ